MISEDLIFNHPILLLWFLNVTVVQRLSEPQIILRGRGRDGNVSNLIFTFLWLSRDKKIVD